MSIQGDAARDLEDAAVELVAYIEGCSESGWQQVSSSEGWAVGALAYHCAVGNDVALGWVCQILAGRHVTDSADTHHAHNAADAERHRGVSPSVAIAAVRRTTERTAHFIRSLTDAELERSAVLGVAGQERSIGQFIPNFGRHMREHLASLRDCVEG